MRVVQFIKLQIYLLILFSFPVYGQNEIEIKQKIRSSLESFMSNLSYVNDEEEPILASTIAIEYGGGNYFVFNGREMKLEHFIEDYCHSDLQRQIVNHTLVLTHEGIVKLDDDKADKRWSVNAILKREYASNPILKIGDEKIKLIVSWNDYNEHISILDIAFQSKPLIIDAVISSQESPFNRNYYKDEDSHKKSKQRKSFFSRLKPQKNRFSFRLFSTFDKRGTLGFGFYGNRSFFHYGFEAIFAITGYNSKYNTKYSELDSDGLHQFFYELSKSTNSGITETEYIRPKMQFTATPGCFLKYISLECGLGIMMAKRVESRSGGGVTWIGDEESVNYFLIRPTITGYVTKWLSISVGYNIYPEAKPFNSFIFGLGFCF